MEEDGIKEEVQEIKPAHFEESMKYARMWAIQASGCTSNLLRLYSNLVVLDPSFDFQNRPTTLQEELHFLQPQLLHLQMICTAEL